MERNESETTFIASQISSLYTLDYLFSQLFNREICFNMLHLSNSCDIWDVFSFKVELKTSKLEEHLFMRGIIDLKSNLNGLLKEVVTDDHTTIKSRLSKYIVQVGLLEFTNLKGNFFEVQF